MRFPCLVTAAVLASATPSVAQAPPAPDPLAPFAGFLGSWTCSGVAHDLAGVAPDRHYVSRIGVRPVINGKWIEFVVRLGPPDAPTLQVEGWDLWGQDPETGDYQEVFLDSAGGAGIGRLVEISSTTVYYRGEGSGPPLERHYEVRLHLTAPTRLSIRYHASADGTTWRLRTEDTCQQLGA